MFLSSGSANDQYKNPHSKINPITIHKVLFPNNPGLKGECHPGSEIISQSRRLPDKVVLKNTGEVQYAEKNRIYPGSRPYHIRALLW
jgi:hypothetical protein